MCLINKHTIDDWTSKGENAHKLITCIWTKKNKYSVIDKSYTRQMGYNTWLNMQQKMKRKKRQKYGN